MGLPFPKDVPCEIVHGFFQQIECCKFASNRYFEQIRYLRFSRLFKVELQLKAVRPEGFCSFQLCCHRNQAVVTVDLRSENAQLLSLLILDLNRRDARIQSI